MSQIGGAAAGEQRAFTIELRNHRDRPVWVIGGTATCECTATADLPIALLPDESRSIKMQVIFLGEPGRFRHSFVLYTDDERQPVITAWFTGRVIEPSASR